MTLSAFKKSALCIAISCISSVCWAGESAVFTYECPSASEITVTPPGYWTAHFKALAGGSDLPMGGTFHGDKPAAFHNLVVWDYDIVHDRVDKHHLFPLCGYNPRPIVSNLDVLVISNGVGNMPQDLSKYNCTVGGVPLKEYKGDLEAECDSSSPSACILSCTSKSR